MRRETGTAQVGRCCLMVIFIKVAIAVECETERDCMSLKMALDMKVINLQKIRLII